MNEIRLASNEDVEPAFVGLEVAGSKRRSAPQNTAEEKSGSGLRRSPAHRATGAKPIRTGGFQAQFSLPTFRVAGCVHLGDSVGKREPWPLQTDLFDELSATDEAVD